VGAPAPLQEGIAAALEGLGRDYYEGLSAEYRERRDVLVPALREAGFACEAPAGAYYVLADFRALSDLPDDRFAFWLTREIGVAPVPGSSFFSRPELGAHLVRFAFCKTLPMLRDAAERLRALRTR
jgi:aminotransferase